MEPTARAAFSRACKRSLRPKPMAELGGRQLLSERMLPRKKGMQVTQPSGFAMPQKTRFNASRPSAMLTTFGAKWLASDENHVPAERPQEREYR